MAQAHLPKYIPAVFSPEDPNLLSLISPAEAQSIALNNDLSTYDASDAAFQSRYRSFWSAERVYEEQVLSELEGNTTPAWQAATVTLALASSAAPIADNAPPGSIGNYAVARSIGLNFTTFRQQGQQDLATLNALFPARQFGLSGQAAVGLQLQNQATFNGVQVGNFLGTNQTAMSNANGQFARNYAEYVREFQRSNKSGAAFRALDGGVTGLYEGWTYGSRYGGYIGGIYGALGGLVGGSIDGASNGYVYRLHENNSATVLGKAYGWYNLPNRGTYGTGLSGSDTNTAVQGAQLAETVYGDFGSGG